MLSSQVKFSADRQTDAGGGGGGGGGGHNDSNFPQTSTIKFNPFPNNPWSLCVCHTNLLKTLQEKEKLLVTSNFSFSHSVFYHFGELCTIFIKSQIVVCKLFQFRRV